MTTFLALLPAIVLMVYIYRKDKAEREPKGLLMGIFLFGAVSVVPVLIMELVLDEILMCFVEPQSGMYLFLEAFVVVAFTEEFWKRWAVKTAAWKNEAFNYRFDAIVYGVFAALGFAVVENVLYVLDGGIVIAALRAVTAVPHHAIDGVIMGYFLGEAKLRELQEDKKGRKRYLRLSVLIPAFIHGVYDYALELESGTVILFWLVFVVAVEIWAILFVRKQSKRDESYRRIRWKMWKRDQISENMVDK